MAIPQDENIMGQGPNNPEVMADKQIGQVMSSLEIAQELNDLILYGYVKG
jgi:hypothetical protein